MSGGPEAPKRISQSLNKDVSEEKIIEYINCEQKRSFNRRI